MATKHYNWTAGTNGNKYGSRKKKRGLIPSYCEICGHSVTKPAKHRIRPGSEGGKYVPGNVIACCRNCHVEADGGMIPRAVQFGIVQKRLQRNVIRKQCLVCKKYRDGSDFGDYPNARDGKRSECLDCKSSFRFADCEEVFHVGEKECSICGDLKPLDRFSRYLFTDSHRRPECDDCRAAIWHNACLVMEEIRG